MGLFDWIKGKKPETGGSALPEGSVMLANDIVLSMLIAPPGGSADSLLARVEAGEFTPVIMDASLFWAMSAVQASDTVRTDRMARLLRYARILPLDGGGDARGHAVASPQEIEHWRNVVFDEGEVFEVEPKPATAAAQQPEMLCSQCYTQCRGSDAHVIPWWNAGDANFLTTYRCSACWLESLDETKTRLSTFDEDARGKLCDFLRRHHLDDLARQLEDAQLPEASALALAFIGEIRSQERVLRP